MKIIYTALFLAEEYRAALLAWFPPRHAKIFGHHVTLIFKPTEEEVKFLEPCLEKEFEIRVWGNEIYDERGQTVCVSVPPHLDLNKQRHHVTISCVEGVTPVYSNELLKKYPYPMTATNMVLKGVVRHFTR